MATKWEYATVSLSSSWRVGGDSKRSLKVRLPGEDESERTGSLAGVLNELGANGWEVVAGGPSEFGNGPVGASLHEYVLKRPVARPARVLQ